FRPGITTAMFDGHCQKLDSLIDQDLANAGPNVNQPPQSFQQLKKKPIYPIGKRLRAYLTRYARERTLPTSYQRLLEWSDAIPLYDSHGEDTLWRTVIYDPQEMKEMSRALLQIYSLMKTEGDTRFLSHLYVDRVDYCTFGNSNPFRVRIVNSHNDNQDYYYVKQADASRVYGLELEHLLSPNRMHFLTHQNTLIEEHI